MLLLFLFCVLFLFASSSSSGRTERRPSLLLLLLPIPIFCFFSAGPIAFNIPSSPLHILLAMYHIRNHAAPHHDENSKHGGADSKAVAKGGFKAAANTRRALGDIGNLVVTVCPNNDTEGAKKPVDRPITRSFGAQLANKKALTHQTKEDNKIDGVTVRSIKAAVAPKERRGRTLTSTLTSRSEAISGGVSKVKKVDELPNIDAEDVGNQLAVVDYVEDIYSFYRKTEAQSCVDPDYMSQQTSINHNMRAILVDWLIEVHYKFKLMPETLFLTTNVMDRFLANRTVERKNLQLVGMTALLIASKYEEIWAPEVKDLIFISDNAYTREQILNMEKTILNVLKFNLCVPTPYVFIVRLLKAAKSDNQTDLSKKVEMLAFYYVELCLVSYEMVKFPPSLLAASAVYIARNALKAKEDCWHKVLKYHSGYEETQLLDCARKMVNLHEKSRDGELTVVHRKYALEKYGSVANVSAPAI